MADSEKQDMRTDQKKQTIRISVRALVEFILRSGDLDNRRSGFAEKEAMQKGSRMHRKIQKQMGEGYRSEVVLSHAAEYEDCIILLEGRADGILDGADGVVIDEIKGVYRSLRWIEEPKEVHLAQAKCYAYIYGRQKGCQKVTVWMTYCNLQTEDIRRFEREYDMETLEAWFGQVMDAYIMWIRWDRDWKRARNASMRGLEFPFAYRDGQREVVTSVYRTILRRKQLFIQAPTGVGKTMSTIFPAVRAIGEGLAEKVFYLTAKTITRKVAWEALALLQTRGLKCKTIVLTAKEKLCVCEEMDCNPSNCPRAKGHFDRVNAAVFELLQEDISYDRETILRSSEKHQVCPYEMSLDLAVWMDVIICDYNYVFDPQAQLKRFFFG